MQRWIVMAGFVAVAVGVITLFVPLSVDFEGMVMTCGSAAAPDDVPLCTEAVGGWRLAGVTVIVVGALAAAVAWLNGADVWTREVTEVRRSYAVEQ